MPRLTLSPHRRIAMTAGVIAILTCATFSRVLRFDFSYDDWWTVVHNRSLDQPLGALLSALAAGEGLSRGIPDMTRPAHVAMLWLDRRMWDMWPVGYHLHSLVLYGATCALAFLAAFSVSRKFRLAAVAATVFALSPLHGEVVAAVHYRENLIAALGVLGPLAWFFWPKRGQASLWTHLGFAAIWTYGLLGKESAAALVPILGATWLIRFRGRLRTRQAEDTALALTATFIVWANWRGALLLAGDDVPRADWDGFGNVLLSTMRFVVRAAAESVLPLWWSPEYADLGPARWYWAIPFAALAALVAWLARRRVTRIPALGLAIAALAPLPASPLARPVNEWADRYLFIAVFGGALLWGWLADRAWARFGLRVTWIPMAVASAVLFVVAQQAIAPWRSDAALWSTAVVRAPTSARSWTGLSRVHRLAGDVGSAQEAVERALHLEPDFVPAHVTQVYTLLALGRPDAARQYVARLHLAGHAHARGLERASRCAALDAESAKECIRR
jgi:protein O-mannosyl-transferase